MTDTPNPSTPSPASELRAEFRSWCEAWKTCLQNVLAQVSGQPSPFETSPEPLPEANSDLWYTVAAGGALQGEMTLRLPAASGNRLGQTLLGETPPAAAPGSEAQPESAAAENITAENKEALEELLRQVAGLAATALAATAGGEVQFSVSASARPSWTPDAVARFRASNQAQGAPPIALEIQISPSLAAELRPRAALTSDPASSAASAAASASASSSSSNYRRLMDVGLDVKLRFGTRRMPLRDVLALSAGVVVELDNALHSPVDLLLDGRLIAQGEVVVVDGKYGLRISGVVDPTPPAASPN